MKLFKFKSLEGDGLIHSLDMIVNGRIYISSHHSKNDPFEGGCLTDENRASWLQENNQEKLIKLRSIVDSTKFTSFTRDYDNELLWAHYAGGFTGVCFEYEIDEKAYDIREMDYEGMPCPSIEEVEEIINGKLKPQDIGILKSKSECWEYEHEYRLFSEPSLKNSHIEAKPIRIIFGMKNLKYVDVFRQITKKYGIQINYLIKDQDKLVAYDL